MIKIKALILDLDGVICDTANLHFIAWKKLASEYNYELSLEDNEQLKGVNRVDSLKYILAKAKKEISTAQFEQDMERKNQWYLEEVEKLSPENAFNGSEKFLQQAKEKNYLLALGSASKNANLVLDKLQLTHYFNYIVDANTVRFGKPHPETFITAAIGLNMKPNNCAVFEDSHVGILAANAADMLSIGIGTKQNLPEAVLVFPSLASFNFDVL